MAGSGGGWIVMITMSVSAVMNAIGRLDVSATVLEKRRKRLGETLIFRSPGRGTVN